MIQGLPQGQTRSDHDSNLSGQRDDAEIDILNANGPAVTAEYEGLVNNMGWLASAASRKSTAVWYG
jgi:hypothetical protein